LLKAVVGPTREGGLTVYFESALWGLPSCLCSVVSREVRCALSCYATRKRGPARSAQSPTLPRNLPRVQATIRGLEIPERRFIFDYWFEVQITYKEKCFIHHVATNDPLVASVYAYFLLVGYWSTLLGQRRYERILRRPCCLEQNHSVARSASCLTTQCRD
jgi:hypothetical protein